MPVSCSNQLISKLLGKKVDSSFNLGVYTCKTRSLTQIISRNSSSPAVQVPTAPSTLRTPASAQVASLCQLDSCQHCTFMKPGAAQGLATPRSLSRLLSPSCEVKREAEQAGLHGTHCTDQGLAPKPRVTQPVGFRWEQIYRRRRRLSGAIV